MWAGFKVASSAITHPAFDHITNNSLLLATNPTCGNSSSQRYSSLPEPAVGRATSGKEPETTASFGRLRVDRTGQGREVVVQPEIRGTVHFHTA